VSVLPASSRGAASLGLSAAAVDTGSPTSGVSAAEWFVGSDPGVGNGHPLVAADGAFGGPVEALTGAIPTASLRYGDQVVGVRAVDLTGNTSVARRAFLVTPVDCVFADGFEGGLGSWSRRVGPTRLVVSSSGAVSGTNGLLVRTSSTLATYLIDETPSRLTQYRARFWFTPHGTRTAGRSVDVFTGRNSLGRTVFRLQYRRVSGGRPQLRVITRRRDGGSALSPWITITDGRHSLEVAWRAASSGGISLEIDGTVRARLGRDTRGLAVDRVLLGPSGGYGAGTAGTLGFDDFVSSRTTRIGQ
jgi:hypothetical protein